MLQEFCQGNICQFFLLISLPLSAEPLNSLRFMGASQGQGPEHEQKTSKMKFTVSVVKYETTAQSMTDHTDTHAQRTSMVYEAQFRVMLNVS